jgi:nicotinamide-nucleotide amidase
MSMILPEDARIMALAEALGRALVARQWRVATAESCTGGLVAGAITAIAGSSAWFDRGFVTYTNEAKCELLGVPAALIAREGAVSEAVARAMAEGALARSQADLVTAVTGIAGPGGGSAAKPVGTVCFAWGRRGGAGDAVTRRLHGDRAAVRSQAAAVALEGLIARIA